MREVPTRRRFCGAVVSTAGLVTMEGVGSPAWSAQPATTKPIEISSPDGAIVACLLPPTGPSDPLCWRASFRGQELVGPSRLGLLLENGRSLGTGATFLSKRIEPIDRSWRPTYGIADRYDGRANQLVAHFLDRTSGIRFAIHLLVFNAGLALRYRIESADKPDLTFTGEATEWRFPVTARVWASRDEGEYRRSEPHAIDPVPVPELTTSTDRGALADTPLLAQLDNDVHALIGESDRLHYPRMMLAPGDSPSSLRSHLMRYPGRATGYSGPGDTHEATAFSMEAPCSTPWRYMIVGARARDLIELAGLVTTLASPNRLGDTSWLRPGKAFRIPAPFTNEAARNGIAFAAKRKLDYIEFDAHWYGDGTDPSDATVAIAGLDMEAIVAQARGAGLGTILYVDRVPVMRQRDAILETYRRWGVAGIKFGFVWEGRQEDTDFIYDLVLACGRHKLFVDLHDNLRPAGLERTLPNYMALEGVRGNEQFPSATHNVTLPFIRGLAGPSDYTICYAHPRNRTTNAHQLAMAAVYYSPLTFLYWYDHPEKYDHGEWPELRWFDSCPTSWSETKALAGTPGSHVVVARRAGGRWFLGAMTNEQAREIDIDLAFLRSGTWLATIYADGAPAAEPRLTRVEIGTRRVTPGDILRLALAPSGGQAIMFEPAA